MGSGLCGRSCVFVSGPSASSTLIVPVVKNSRLCATALRAMRDRGKHGEIVDHGSNSSGTPTRKFKVDGTLPVSLVGSRSADLLGELFRHLLPKLDLQDRERIDEFSFDEDGRRTPHAAVLGRHRVLTYP